MIHVRVTDELKSRLEASAKADGRSLNAEIVHLLDFALRARGETGMQVIESMRLLSRDDIQSIVRILLNAADRIDEDSSPPQQ